MSKYHTRTMKKKQRICSALPNPTHSPASLGSEATVKDVDSGKCSCSCSVLLVPVLLYASLSWKKNKATCVKAFTANSDAGFVSGVLIGSFTLLNTMC